MKTLVDFTNGMRQAARHRTTCIAVLSAFVAAACESASAPAPVATVSPFVVSNAVAALSGAGASAAATTAPDAQGSVVYVGLPPGSIPGTPTVTINVRPTGKSVSVNLVDGGLDPVAVPAAVGDTLEIDVRGSDGTVNLRYLLPVPAAMRPVVIRTNPPKGKRDVPLNTTLRIVFSEPIDGVSLNTSSVRLVSGAGQVSGTLAFADPEHLTADFTPDAPLALGTDYALEITTGITDLDGQSLESSVAVPFTTVAQAMSATELVFAVQPSNVDIGQPMTPDIQVVARNAAGLTATDFNGTVFLVLADGFPAVLSNTQTTAVAGVATFTNVRISRSGQGIRFIASALTMSVRSASFDVRPEQVSGQIAFVRTVDNSSQIYLVNADGSGLTRLTRDGGQHNHPAWSPDGTKIAYTSDQTGVSEIYVMNADGSGVVRLTNDGGGSADPAWSPDGSKIAFARSDGPFTGAIAVMNADGSGVTTLTQGSAQTDMWDRWPAWSPDGSKIAFNRDLLDELTPTNIYIMNADGSGVHVLNVQLVGTGSASYAESAPAWSPDGTTILFWSYWADPTFSANGSGAFATRNADGSGSLTRLPVDVPVSYWSEPDWAPDGRHIVFSSRGPNGFPNGDIYVSRLDGFGTLRLTTSGYDSQPAWRPR